MLLHEGLPVKLFLGLAGTSYVSFTARPTFILPAYARSTYTELLSKIEQGEKNEL
jgi:hypothetical protein